MDEIDKKILKILSKDARTPFKDVAKDIGVSIDTVSKRYRKLKEKGTIQNVTIILDLRKTGKGLIANIGAKIDSGYINEAVQEINKVIEIFLIGKSFGAHDLVAIVIVRDLEHLESLISKVSKLPYVKSLDVSILTSPLSIHAERQIPEQKD